MSSQPHHPHIVLLSGAGAPLMGSEIRGRQSSWLALLGEMSKEDQPVLCKAARPCFFKSVA